MLGFEISQPLYQQAYERVKESILTGEIKPGSKIIVTKLAKEYQVSRTPLREALRQLQKEGLLIQNNLGTRVVSIELADYEELCLCRLVLERQVMSMVVVEISNEKLKITEEIVKKSKEALKSKAPIKSLILVLNSRFHETLYSTCSNSRLVQMLDQVRSFLLIYRANVLKHPEYNHEIFEEHEAIFKSVKERNTTKTIEAVEIHLNNDLERGRILLGKDSQIRNKLKN